MGEFYLLREIDATIIISSMFCFSLPRESPIEDESHGGSQCVAEEGKTSESYMDFPGLKGQCSYRP